MHTILRHANNTKDTVDAPAQHLEAVAVTISTNLRGRLRNTSLPPTKGLFPLFEAVTNSLQAIAALHPEDPAAGSIQVEILRRAQAPLALADAKSKNWFVPLEPIAGFRVIDDGIGFDDRNFKSFEQLDTDHKEREGCRGVGRLLWLKAFKRAAVVSTYEHAAGVWKQRQFTFDDGMGYFGYNESFKAYIEVSSYDRVLVSARERNRAFFDKLGLPNN